MRQARLTDRARKANGTSFVVIAGRVSEGFPNSAVIKPLFPVIINDVGVPQLLILSFTLSIVKEIHAQASLGEHSNF